MESPNRQTTVRMCAAGCHARACRLQGKADKHRPFAPLPLFGTPRASRLRSGASLRPSSGCACCSAARPACAGPASAWMARGQAPAGRAGGVLPGALPACDAASGAMLIRLPLQARRSPQSRLLHVHGSQSLTPPPPEPLADSAYRLHRQHLLDTLFAFCLQFSLACKKDPREWSLTSRSASSWSINRRLRGRLQA